ncbi:MAG: hypothetical protein H7256_06185 [Bdellovibrio sp.]|nr:hypothetical protein [Bdellovibrio sp.]
MKSFAVSSTNKSTQQATAGWNRKNLRIATFNAQDFTLYEKPESKSSRAAPKSEKLAKAVAKTLFEANPDVIVLQEIGSKYSLQKLADLSTNEKYDAILIQGHDTPDMNKGDRGPARHIGFLIKKSLVLEHTVAANLRIPYEGKDPKRKYLFDRGLPIISFFDPNTKMALFSVIGAHNHSLGEQAKFSELKFLEEKSMVSVIQKLQDAYGAQYPIILAGDLNTEVNGNHRLQKLKSKMVESFDQINIPSTSPKRVSHIIFPKPNQISSLARQIDGVFVNSALSGRITSSQTLIFPIDDVSDHRPIVVDINLEGVIP